MYFIAHINIARRLYPFSDSMMDDFHILWKEINLLADHSPGFIWRMPDDDPVYDSPYEEDKWIIINMSIWATIHDFASFVSSKDHVQAMKRRRQWFERFERPNQAIWWVPQGYIPTVEEAKQRLDHLHKHGPMQYAFTVKHPFPAPDEDEQTTS